MESKNLIFVTSEAEDHTHQILVPDGIIPDGWYSTTATNGHSHGIMIEENLHPGGSVTVVTGLQFGPSSDDDHAHEVTITAQEESDSNSDEGSGAEDGRDESETHLPDDDKMKSSFIAHDGHAPPMEVKLFGGHVVEYKEITRDTKAGPIRLGVIEVLIATWDEDTGGIFGIPDRFQQGAFAESILEHRARNDRQVRLKNQHGWTMGGFPIATVSETDQGLFAIGEINLGRQDGRESWELIKQRVLVDMSVGFSSLEDEIIEGVRVIKKAILWEGSVVDEPANRNAAILNFKATPFADLPIAPIDHPWNATAAGRRVDSFVAAGEAELKSAFLEEKNAADEAFALQVADVIDGHLTIVPAALQKAVDQLRGKEGTSELVEHIERYFAKMGVPSPFEDDQRQFYGAAEVREWKAAEIEKALVSDVRFSRGAAKVLAARLTSSNGSRYDVKVIGMILHNLEEARKLVESR